MAAASASKARNKRMLDGAKAETNKKAKAALDKEQAKQQAAGGRTESIRTSTTG